MQPVLAGWAAGMVFLAIFTAVITGLEESGSRMAFVAFIVLAALAGIGWYFAPLVQP